MKEFLTLEDACIYLDLSRQTIYNLCYEGKIRKYKPNGGKLYFKRSDLDNFILGVSIKETSTIQEVVQ